MNTVKKLGFREIWIFYYYFNTWAFVFHGSSSSSCRFRLISWTVTLWRQRAVITVILMVYWDVFTTEYHSIMWRKWEQIQACSVSVLCYLLAKNTNWNKVNNENVGFGRMRKSVITFHTNNIRMRSHSKFIVVTLYKALVIYVIASYPGKCCANWIPTKIIELIRMSTFKT
jgi:hypothetical protein